MPHWVKCYSDTLTQYQGHRVCVEHVHVIEVIHCVPLLQQLSQIPLGWGYGVVDKHLTTYNKFTPLHRAPLRQISEWEHASSHLQEESFCWSPGRKRLNVWWGSKPPQHIRSLKMSTSAKQSWAQKCSCVHPALDGLVSFFHLLSSPELFLSVHLLKSMACRCKRVFFPLCWAQQGTWCTSSFTLSLSATFTQFHPPVHLSSFHWLILTSSYLHFHSLLISFLLFNSPLLFPLLFSSYTCSTEYSMCCPFLSPPLLSCNCSSSGVCTPIN